MAAAAGIMNGGLAGNGLNAAAAADGLCRPADMEPGTPKYGFPPPLYGCACGPTFSCLRHLARRF